MAATFGPGKLAPLLAADLYHYDPSPAYQAWLRSRESPSEWQGFESHNPLRGLPHDLDPSSNRPRPRTTITCRHEWKIEFARSYVPLNGETPQAGEVRSVACVCHRCHWHLRVQVEFGDLPEGHPGYCPTRNAPFHHLTPISRTQPSSRDGNDESYQFRCSACSTFVDIAYRPPVLSKRDMNNLVDEERLERRCHAALSTDAHREGVQPQDPINVLDALAAYLRDAACGDPKRTRRPIPIYNKRWMLSFGEDCDELFSRLGFSRSPDGSVITLPQIPAHGEPDPQGSRALVLDAREELFSFIAQNYTVREQKGLRFVSEDEVRDQPRPGDLLKLLLGISAYRRDLSDKAFAENEDCYTGLGALHDFSDDVIVYAFERQTTCDPEHSPFYFDCFTNIATTRRSEVLEIELAKMQSQGYYGWEEVQKAYRYFNLEAADSDQMADEYILGVFQSRLASEPRHRDAEMRQHLRIIGQSRGSAMLQDSASNLLQTADQAYRYLDNTVEDGSKLSDDMVLALLAAKISEDRASEETCRRAAEILANERNSDSIRAWLASGEVNMAGGDDPVTAAYQFFSITDRTGQVDLDVLENTVIHGYGGDKLEEARKHYDVLRAHVSGQDANGSQAKPDYSAPVGLHNQGNTCYLNSLLQYLFAIRPFREIILNLAQYKDDVTEEGFQNKRIGGFSVTRQETKVSQEFVDELQQLFLEMAHAPGPSVYPTWKLACLALKGEEMAARRSTVSGERPNLGKKDSIVGKEPIQETIQELPNDEDSPASMVDSVTVLPDTSSDTTLVDEIIVTPESDDANRAEGEATVPVANMLGTNDAKDAVDTSAVETEPRKDEVSGNTNGMIGPQLPPDHAPPERAPPPVPPRPGQSAEKQNNDSWRAEAEKAAMQHDVTEVLQDVLYKTECAIKPTSILEDGEQDDQIKYLFYGTQEWTYLDKDTEDKDERFAQITCALTTKPRDVYDALHEYFDSAFIELNKKNVRRYGTIKQAPPVLQLMLQRQVYDADAKDNKLVKHHIEINETLYLDRFLQDVDGDLKQKIQTYWDAKHKHKQYSEKRELHQVLDGDDVDALGGTYEYIRKLGESDAEVEVAANPAETASTPKTTNGVEDAGSEPFDLVSDNMLLDDLELDPEFIESTKSLARKTAEKKKTQIDVLEQELPKAKEELETALEALKEYQQHRYELAAVFVHRGRGGSRGGHYWIYIHDFKDNLWRCYNDSDVRIVEDPHKEIANLSDPEVTGAPYFVVYVAEDQKEQFFSPLFRSAPAGEQQNTAEGDTEMNEINPDLNAHTIHQEPNGDTTMTNPSFAALNNGAEEASLASAAEGHIV